jgi:hypothetical protein
MRVIDEGPVVSVWKTKARHGKIIRVSSGINKCVVILTMLGPKGGLHGQAIMTLEEARELARDLLEAAAGE